LDWGVIIGDVIHNLRSSLDSLVWELTIKHSGDPIDPNANQWRNVQFPIVTEANKWSPQESKCLWGIQPSLKPYFEHLQPFHAGQNAAPNEPFVILQSLSNIDKHRHIHFVSYFIGLDDLQFKSPHPVPDEFKVIEKRFPGPFIDGAELGRGKVTGNVIMSIPPTLVYMNAIHAFDITFDQGEPAEGESVISVLESLRDKTSSVLNDFKSEFP
jgi:hypothetical protein